MDLFTATSATGSWQEVLAPDAVVLRQYVASRDSAVLAAIDSVVRQTPFRIMSTPGGGKMSVGLTSCGKYGWVSDQHGYRYSATDPQTDAAWPAMPDVLYALGHQAAAEAGFQDFSPDVCLINCYFPGAKMGLHQDKDERDFSAPIVSVSLGIPATFQFGGRKRTDKPLKVPLQHGDVVVWGGKSRLNFHGVLTVRKAWHPLTGDQRINLTFRKAR